MGSFIGHVVPGTFWGIFGLWWTWAIFHRYFMWQRTVIGRAIQDDTKKRSLRWQNMLSFPCSCCPSVPLEGIIKVVAVVIGMTGEYVTGFENGTFTHIGNAQHMTMFFFFGLNGIVDIISRCKPNIVPVNLDYVSGILAMLMEALIFANHLHGRSSMDIQVHTFLIYLILSGAIATACEMTFKNQVLPSLLRIFFSLLQATWFYQIGFILYPPSGNNWDQENHKQMMFITLFFAWHIAAVFIFMSLVGVLVYFRVRCIDRSQIYKSLHNHNGIKSTNKIESEQLRNMLGESDEEL